MDARAGRAARRSCRSSARPGSAGPPDGRLRDARVSRLGAVSARSVNGCSHSLNRTFCRKMRRTASSMRAIGTRLSATSALRSVDEVTVVDWHHHHVDSGVDGDLDVLLVVVGHLVDGGPVGDDEPLEAQLVFEEAGDEGPVSVHRLVVPARVRDHDAANARLEACDVAGKVDPAQLLEGEARVALIHAAVGAAVAQEVLGGRQDGAAGWRRGFLISPNGSRAQELGQLGGFTVTL